MRLWLSSQASDVTCELGTSCENSTKRRGSGAQLWNCSQQLQLLFPVKSASYSKRSPVSYADLSKQRDSNLHCHQNTQRVRAERRRTFPQRSKGSSSIQTRHTELKKMNLRAFFPSGLFGYTVTLPATYREPLFSLSSC